MIKHIGTLPCSYLIIIPIKFRSLVIVREYIFVNKSFSLKILKIDFKELIQYKVATKTSHMQSLNENHFFSF